MNNSLEFARNIRRTILEQSKRANVGHIGSALSIADIIAALYSGPLSKVDPSNSDRDRFVLSKGHAALAMYSAMHHSQLLDELTLNMFCGDHSAVGVHPEHILPGVDFSTGSLGQGISFGTGAALAGQMKKSNRRVFVVMSDAEMNEGVTWEAVMFAAHHKLSRLIVIVDVNGQQALGYTESVLNLTPLDTRWRAFGWDVHEVDGHDVDGMRETIESLNVNDGPPHVLLADTTFGKGVTYMERQIKWHYWPMNDEEYHLALEGLGGAL